MFSSVSVVSFVSFVFLAPVGQTMRAWRGSGACRRTHAVTCSTVLALVLTGMHAHAQQPPSPPALPTAYRGSEIDRALQARDWPKAEALLVAAIETAPNSHALLQALGSVFLARQKPLNAAIAIKKAEALGPIDNSTRFTLALAYLALERGDWARPELERLAAAEPANVTYDYWLGRIDYDAGHYAAAARRFERVLAADPSSVRAHDNLGLSYDALNEPDRALAHHRKAAELNRAAETKSAWPPLNFAIVLRRGGDLAGAEALLREAIGYEGTLPQAHYQLGMVLEQDDRLEEAVRALELAADRDPTYADPHYALARVYRLLGRANEAQRALAAFERLRDTSREVRQR